MAKRKAKQSLREFKAWLQGVEELHPKDWSPNKDQWVLIREKIDNIKETQVRRITSVNDNIVPNNTNNGYNNQSNFNTAQVNPAPVNNIPPAPLVNSTLSSIGLPIDNSNHALAVKDGKIVTPDIDTSDGNITSPFE